MARISLLILLLAILALLTDLAIAQEINQRITAAKSEFAREFVRDVEVIQRKYIQALELNLRTFTQAGDLDAAREAHEEFKRARSWRTIPATYGARRLQNEQLNALLRSYEGALENAVRPAVSRHTAKLEGLKEFFLTSGNLKDATAADEELKRLRKGESIPIDAGARLQYSQFSQSEFAEWLKNITVKFSGMLAGETLVSFAGDKLTYTSRSTPVEYGYEVKGARTVEIFNGGWRIEFARDLHSGTFRTRGNSYEIEILYEGDPGLSGATPPDE